MRGVSLNIEARALASNFAIARSTREVNESLTKLATGKRINRAADDPAGAIAVDAMSAQQKTLEKKIKNLDFERVRLDALDGGESEFANVYIELQSLVVAAANRGAMSDEEREGLQTALDGALQGLQFVSNTFTFRGQQLFGGRNIFEEGAVTETVNGEQVIFSLKDLQRGGKLNLINGDLETAQKVVDAAQKTGASRRAAIGARAQDVESQQRVAMVELEGITGAKSIIEDTDYAAETAKLVRAQLIQQTSIATREIAINLQRDTVLNLLGAVSPVGR
jgi:flagellin